MPNESTPDSTSSTTATPTGPAGAGGAVVTTTTTVKPGWKTTEFWLALAAAILGGAYASGLIKEGSDSSYVKIAAFAAIALTTLGYTVSRGNAKK